MSAVIAGHCAVCHSPTGQEPTRPLTDYAEIFAERSAVLNQVYSCTMPLSGSGQDLSLTERVDLLGWLVCGAPNN